MGGGEMKWGGNGIKKKNKKIGVGRNEMGERE